MKLRIEKSAKLKLSSTLRSWLPILQADLESLHDLLKEYKEKNPFIDIGSGFEKRDQRYIDNFYKNRKSVKDNIEALNIYEKSFEEVLFEQISPPLFPTRKSQKIAYKIIEYINEEGYFVGDEELLAKELGVDVSDINRVRKRFAHLDPVGVGAKDLRESFLFQLESFDLQDRVYKKAVEIIENLDSLDKLKKDKDFKEALSIVKRFKNPPAIEYMEDSGSFMKVPDIIIDMTKEGIEIKLNENYYPSVIVDLEEGYEDNDFVKKKINEAKNLINALSMRKETLYKVALMLVEYQYDFFMGGEKKPMKLADLAKELGYNASTISRAVSNKYLSCSRGIIPIKSFFTTAIEEDISNDAIKNYIVEIIKKEDRSKPLSDAKIVVLIEEKFGVKLGRRTVAKYRQQLNIAGSSERKRNYALSLESV